MDEKNIPNPLQIDLTMSVFTKKVIQELGEFLKENESLIQKEWTPMNNTVII